MNWFKRHLNLTWLFGALFVCLLGAVLITFAGLGFLEKGSNQAYFFIWCMLPLNGWILWQKGRSLHWLWLAFFFVPFIPVVLRNKKRSSRKQKTLASNTKAVKINKQKQKRQQLTPKPLKFNKVFYILGIVFSALFVLGILVSIPLVITKDYQKEDYVFYILDPSPEEAVANDIFDPSSDANFSALLYGRTSEYFSGIGYSCIELNNDTWPAGYLAIFKCSSHDIDKLYSYLDDMKVIYSPIGDVDQKLWGTYYSDFLQAYPYEKFIK